MVSKIGTWAGKAEDNVTEIGRPSGRAVRVLAEGKGRAAALHVRLTHKDARGKRFYVIPYSSWLAADGNDGGEMVLYFTGHEITLKGRNLETLIAGLEGQRLAFIQEFDSHLHEEPENGEPCIESIKVEVQG